MEKSSGVGRLVFGFIRGLCDRKRKAVALSVGHPPLTDGYKPNTKAQRNLTVNSVSHPIKRRDRHSFTKS